MSMGMISDVSTPSKGFGMPENSISSLFQTLNINLLYDPQAVNGIGGVVSEAETIATRIVQKIVQDGSTILYENYLGLKLTDHSLTLNSTLMERIMEQEIIFYDDFSEIPEYFIQEDQEPLPSHHENWKALSVQVGNKQVEEVGNLLPQSTKDMDAVSIQSQSRRSFITSKPKKNDSLFVNSPNSKGSNTPNVKGTNTKGNTNKSQFDIDISKLVDLSIPREIVREEEQLRVLKEREFLIKQEKLNMEAVRNQEYKDQQARLRGMQDVNKKQFTYDFDGKFILTNPVKIEKLPPFSYAVAITVTKVDPKLIQSSAVVGPNKDLSSGNNQSNGTPNDKQPEIVVNDEKRNSKRFLQPLGLQAAAQVPEKANTPQFYASGDGKEMFEQFKMANGVTLIDTAKQKKGPKFGANLDLSDVGQSALNMSLSQLGSTIRMTKNEYNSVIKSGNLAKSTPQLLQNSIKASQAAGALGNNSMINAKSKNINNISNSNIESKQLDSHFLPNGTSFLLNDSRNKINNNNSISNNSVLVPTKQKSRTSLHNISSIKIPDRYKLIETMHDIDKLTQEQIKEIEVARLKSERMTTEKKAAADKILSFNPIDEFNRLVYENKHVSDKNASSNTLPPLVTPKSNEYVRAKQSIGFLSQNPRERAPRHVINANIIHTRLPPPAVGKTLGHGLNQGFNPGNLDSLEAVLDRVQNSSMNNASSVLK